MKKMEMKDRIAKIIKKEQLTSQQFAEIIEIQSSTISHILAGRNLPSFKIISNLLERFPKISPDWLIFGSGDMYREEERARVIDNYLVNDAMFTNRSPEDVDNKVISDDLSSEEPYIYKDEVVEDSNNSIESTANETKGNEIDTATYSVTPEKIIVMYSNKTFEIFNPK